MMKYFPSGSMAIVSAPAFCIRSPLKRKTVLMIRTVFVCLSLPESKT